MSEDDVASEVDITVTKQESSPNESNDPVLKISQLINEMKYLLKRIFSQNNASQLQQSSGPRSGSKRKDSSDGRRGNLLAIVQQKRSEDDHVFLHAEDGSVFDRSGDDIEKEVDPIAEYSSSNHQKGDKDTTSNSEAEQERHKNLLASVQGEMGPL